MRHYNGWLWGTLREKFGMIVGNNYSPLITINTKFETFQIWCPPPADYIVSADCVLEVAEIGANIISYATTWGRPSREGLAAAEYHSMKIMPHGATIEMIRRKAI